LVLTSRDGWFLAKLLDPALNQPGCCEGGRLVVLREPPNRVRAGGPLAALHRRDQERSCPEPVRLPQHRLDGKVCGVIPRPLGVEGARGRWRTFTLSGDTGTQERGITT
jgi:hypothetical protein